jgi:hypothetical protein
MVYISVPSNTHASSEPYVRKNRALGLVFIIGASSALWTIIILSAKVFFRT